MYIDAFAGPGKHRSRETGGFVRGSPQIAIEINPPFKEYHFVDIDSDKANDISNQCQAANTSFFSKQWGGINKKKMGRELEGRTWDEMPLLAESMLR